MPWPRFCASSSSAKVESPRMLIRFDRVHLHGDVQAHRCPKDMFRCRKLSPDRISR